jgi:membrane peptidoglycan carboxypeptidase
MNVQRPTRRDRSGLAGPGASRAAKVRPRRRLRWLRRLVAAAVVVAVVVVAAFALLLELTPPVTDAPRLVAAGLAMHGAPSDDGRIPAKVAAALLATEDSRYDHDPAVDWRGAARAAWGAVAARHDAGGATIEIQLAKLLYTPGRSGLGVELEQVALAVKLDQHFTKGEILAMYLDAAYFGDGAYGITAAAHHYFALSPGELSWAQASLLAGLVQAPTDYDPHGHLHLALLRRRHVLDRLVATGVLTRGQVGSIERAPLHPAVPFTG